VFPTLGSGTIARGSADIGARAVRTLLRLHTARRDIQLLEGTHLEFLLRTGAYRQFGFATFGDFAREVLGKSERSARRQIALRRLVLVSPELSQALTDGRITPCQALALEPLVGKEDLEPWVLLASDCSVTELQRAVLEHANGECAPEEEPGRQIRFPAPRSAALAWDHGVEWARRVLGWHAPKFICVEAVLSEASSLWMGSEIPGNGTQPETPSKPLPDSRMRCAVGSPGQKEQLSPTALNELLACLREAERALGALAKDAEPPQNGSESVRILRSLKVTDRCLRILFVRLLKELDRAGLLSKTGYRTPRQFLIHGFKLSERTAARLLSEAWLFEESPCLRDAFTQGTIGLGQAYLIDRVARGNAVPSFIKRAQSVTHLHFEREIQFLQRLREYLPDLAQRFPRPLPAPGLEDALRRGLLGIGWTDDQIEHELKEYIPWAEPASTQESDPAVDPLVLRRLESLLEMFVLALEKRDSSDPNGLPTLAALHRLGSSPFGRGTMRTLAARPTTVTFWAPESVIQLWNRAVGAIQGRYGPLSVWAASILLLETALKEWRKEDPSHRPASHRIQERDEWRCQAPGCSSRQRLESHHIIFRSHEGDDDPDNLITLCHGHHRHGIHEGVLRVRGTAPSKLTWELGTMREMWAGNKRVISTMTY
jgi:hypothetical protein